MSDASTPPEKSPLVSFENATLGYRDRIVLEGVDLEVNEGDFIAIVGPNGSGKTTILRSILGILPPRSGRCRTRGRPGYSPQRSALDPIFPFMAEEVVEMGLLADPEPELDDDGEFDRKAWKRDAKEKVSRALDACGMHGHRRTAFRDLSGGQKQRVLVARALVSEPDVLVLDEPTNDLDLRGEHDVMELIRSVHQAGRTVIMVSHLLAVVARYAHRIALIADGHLISGTTAEILTDERLADVYGIPVIVHDSEAGKMIAPGRGGATS